MTRACAAAVWRTCDSPLGQFAVAAQAHALIAVVLPGLPRPQAVTELEDGEDRRRAEVLAARACAQLTEYFAGERTRFTLPTDLVLSRGPFAARVQRALAQIPYGQTRSYGELAAMVCPEDGFPRKPDPAMFTHMLNKHRLDPARTLAIGDRPIDITTAHKVGVAGFPPGGCAPHPPLHQSGHHRVIAPFRDSGSGVSGARAGAKRLVENHATARDGACA
ncbi:HAD hydrolase-like protein [Actinotignum timonense]|uniref:HAD hydrolase-like protein n=1 Tax=Actinotignum timonense TaxID=1870995 RepID=UPI002A811FF9|nr:HAD hydrolase-like protein [Actinotignum timonense]MDY5137727.1 HAD hydrolase-like protein [Actinotignum timonense]